MMLHQRKANPIVMRYAKVRYCPECGSIGEVSPPALDCCPTAKPEHVSMEVAKQARGFINNSIERKV